MKATTGICFILIMLFITHQGYGQTRVTGHVSAEVVESVSLQNNFNTSVKLNEKTNPSINLGSIGLRGPQNSTVDIYAGNITVSNNIEAFKLRTDINNSVLANTDTQDVSFSAIMDQKINNGIYDANLIVIVSYN